MPLPKLDYPMYSIKVPSMKKEYSFRPFLVKEEKLLLMAKESEVSAESLSAIKQVVNNCLIDKLDVNKMTVFDLEYVFLKLRAVSVENKVKVSYKDFEDDKLYDFEVDLNDVEITYPEKKDNIIKINKNSGLTMIYPSASLYDDKEFLTLEKDHMFELIIRCIENIFINDEIYKPADYSKKDIEEFLENLDVKTFESINEFLLNAPKIEHTLTYTNSLGNERKIVLSSLNDFFTLR
jgi:hypothetical protein